MKVILFVGMVFLVSCNMQNYCSKHYPPIAGKDSSNTTTISYIHHDSLEKQPKDSAWYYALIECQKNSQGQYVPVITSQTTAQGNRIKIKHELSGDTIYVNCKIDTFSVVASWNEKHVTVVSKSKENDVQRVNYLTNWQVFWVMWAKILTVILAVIGAVFVVVKFSKSSWFTVAITAIKSVASIAIKKKLKQ